MNEEAFTAEFPNLCDVFHGNAFQMITIQEETFCLSNESLAREVLWQD